MVDASLVRVGLGLLLLLVSLGCGSGGEPTGEDGGSPWEPPPRDAGAWTPIEEPDGGWFEDDGGFYPERYVFGEEILCDRYARASFPRCMVGEERCCQPNDFETTSSCIGVNDDCHWYSVEGYCDGPEDCAPGMVCCTHFGYGHRAGLTNTCEPPTECLNRRSFSIVCRSDEDCIHSDRPNCCFGGAAIGFVCYPPSGPLVGTCDLENFVPKDEPDEWYD